MHLPSQVTMVDVGPRDGLQSEPETVSIKTRTVLIEKLANTGLSRIKAGSFVSSKVSLARAGEEKE